MSVLEMWCVDRIQQTKSSTELSMIWVCILMLSHTKIDLLTLVLFAWSRGQYSDDWAARIAEAKVSVERNGPTGTFAESRPGTAGCKFAVTITFSGARWAASSTYSAGGPGGRSTGLT